MLVFETLPRILVCDEASMTYPDRADTHLALVYISIVSIERVLISHENAAAGQSHLERSVLCFSDFWITSGEQKWYLDMPQRESIFSFKYS